jgi:hypothetical protein
VIEVNVALSKIFPGHLRITETDPDERFPQAGLGNQKYYGNGTIRKKVYPLHLWKMYIC